MSKEPIENSDPTSLEQRIAELEQKLSTQQEQLEKQESLLIEQETRPHKFILNWLIYRKKDWKTDRRSRSAIITFWVRVFFSPASVAAAGGLIGLATVGLLWWQNSEVGYQSEKITEQIELQKRSFEVARKTDLITLLKNDDEDVKQAAFLEFYSDTSFFFDTDLYLGNTNLSGAYLSGFTHDVIEMDTLRIENSQVLNSNLSFKLFLLKSENTSYRRTTIGESQFVSDDKYLEDPPEASFIRSDFYNSQISYGKLYFLDSWIIDSSIKSKNDEFFDRYFLGNHCAFIKDTIQLPIGVEKISVERSLFYKCHLDFSENYLFLSKAVDKEYLDRIHFKGFRDNLFVDCTFSVEALEVIQFMNGQLWRDRQNVSIDTLDMMMSYNEKSLKIDVDDGSGQPLVDIYLDRDLSGYNYNEKFDKLFELVDSLTVTN